jgi:diguanylate cyclase (GGDEF)-like protein/PAS domain S-box-containing protein
MMKADEIKIAIESPFAQSDPLAQMGPGFYRELLDHLSDGVYFVDRERRIHFWNEAARRLTGYAAEEVVGRRCQDGILCHTDPSGRMMCQGECPLSACIADGLHHEAYVFLRHKQGRRVPVWVRVQPIRGADGSIVGAVELFSDDTASNEERSKATAMRRLAFLDHMTQLPNRRYVEITLQTALAESEMHKDELGVLMVDLDNLKEINDVSGHAIGDEVLKQLAQALSSSLRPTDTVGRWGGDEFLAIVRSVNGESLGRLAERSAEQVRRISISDKEGKVITTSISVGAALCRAGESAEDLVRRADQLMYLSKARGKNQVTVDRGSVDGHQALWTGSKA